MLGSVIRHRPGRILLLVALACIAAALIFLPTASAQEAETHHLYGYVVAGLLALVLVYSLGAEARAASRGRGRR
jgi:cytochrome b